MILYPKAIKATAIVRWSEEDEAFLCDSPLSSTLGMLGDTVQEAYDAFLRELDTTIKATNNNMHAFYKEIGDE